MQLWTGQTGFGDSSGGLATLVLDFEAEERSEKAMNYLVCYADPAWTLLTSCSRRLWLPPSDPRRRRRHCRRRSRFTSSAGNHTRVGVLYRDTQKSSMSTEVPSIACSRALSAAATASALPRSLAQRGKVVMWNAITTKWAHRYLPSIKPESPSPRPRPVNSRKRTPASERDGRPPSPRSR